MICVQWRERDGTKGWCATRRRKMPALEGDFVSEPTLCKHFVMLPGIFEDRAPTCVHCKKIFDRKYQAEGGK